MIVLIPSLKGWDGSQGVMIVLIPSLKGVILRCDGCCLKGWDGSIGDGCCLKGWVNNKRSPWKRGLLVVTERTSPQ